MNRNKFTAGKLFKPFIVKGNDIITDRRTGHRWKVFNVLPGKVVVNMTTRGGVSFKEFDFDTLARWFNEDKGK